MSAWMTAVDAQFYWMSAKVPSDEFPLYAFDGEPTDFEHAVDDVRSRARACQALMVRVDDGSSWTYPSWVPTALEPDWLVRHHLDDDSWRGCLDAVVRLADDQLDVRRVPWRLHLFAPVRGLPGGTGPGTVVVMQVAHALADGVRSAALAAWLFGRAAPVPDVLASRGFLPWRAVNAVRAHRKLVRDTRAGLLRPPAGVRPALSTNARPAGVRTVRTLLRQRAQLRGPTVTVAALAALSRALSGHLGDAAGSLVAEVPMAKPGVPHAHNHFANITVGLYPDLDRQARVQRIVADLANGRRRIAAPCGLRGGQGLRCGAGAAAALGCRQIRPRCAAGAGVRQHRGVKCLPWTCRPALRRCAGTADRRQSGALSGDGTHAWRARYRRHRGDHRPRGRIRGR